MIGIALSGGGARGISHLGVLKAFDENDIKPDVISGTSAGAIIGGFYAAGYAPDDILKIIIKTNMLSIFKPAFSWKGLLSMDSLEKILRNNLPPTFEDLGIPLIVAATDIEGGKTTYFEQGGLYKAILASSCLPVLFNPIEIDNVKYIDGGILNNLPVEPLQKRAETIISVGCNPIGTKKINSFKDVMERSSLLAINENTERSKQLAHIFIEPEELIKFSGFDLSKAKEIFDTGYHYTSQNIAIFAKELKL
ncbi:MAG: patatin-like phospholipase family protein [Cyclobacteriaceae bacterium]|nr:patatin-like phospholipase family protein [Cyclobacteriaceae bacterium]